MSSIICKVTEVKLSTNKCINVVLLLTDLRLLLTLAAEKSTTARSRKTSNFDILLLGLHVVAGQREQLLSATRPRPKTSRGSGCSRDRWVAVWYQRLTCRMLMPKTQSLISVNDTACYKISLSQLWCLFLTVACRNCVKLLTPSKFSLILFIPYKQIDCNLLYLAERASNHVTSRPSLTCSFFKNPWRKKSRRSCGKSSPHI